MAGNGVSGLANRLVSLIGGQPSDMLNQGSHDDPTVYKVGDMIIHDHRPSERGIRAMQSNPKSQSIPEPPSVNRPARTEIHTVDPCKTVRVFSSVHVDWRTICAHRNSAVQAHSKLNVSPSSVLRRQYGSLDDLAKWDEFVSTEQNVERFLAVLNEYGDHTMFAGEFADGRIGGKLTIRRSFIKEHCCVAWKQSRKIAATHTGSMEFLATLDTRGGVVAKFHDWLRILILQYHFVVWFIPDEDEDGCMGYMEVYYTASTLAIMYETTCTVRMLMAPVELPNADEPSIMDDIIATAGSDADRQVITYTWVDPMFTQPTNVPEHGAVQATLNYKSKTVWQEVMAETLDRTTVYENAIVSPRTRYLMWYQSQVGVPKAQPLHKVDIPLDAKYVDVQVCVQMHNHIRNLVAETRVGDNVANQFDARHPLCDTTPCGDPQRLPVDLHTYHVVNGEETLLYEVQPSAIINVEYQFHANAFVTFSYNVVASAAGGYRTMQIFDIRFHSEEKVLALNMSEMFMDQENREGNPPEYVDSTRTRAVFFGNIGRID
jgi:hypothetical protein